MDYICYEDVEAELGRLRSLYGLRQSSSDHPSLARL